MQGRCLIACITTLAPHAYNSNSTPITNVSISLPKDTSSPINTPQAHKTQICGLLLSLCFLGSLLLLCLISLSHTYEKDNSESIPFPLIILLFRASIDILSPLQFLPFLIVVIFFFHFDSYFLWFVDHPYYHFN